MNEGRLRLLLLRTFSDVAAAQSTALVALGDSLGFYRTLTGQAMTPEELASATGCQPRLVEEWLRNQLAADYVTLHEERYTLSEEQAAAFGMMGASFALASALTMRVDVLAAAFRGEPLQASEAVADAVARQSRAKYAEAIDTWLPPEIRTRLEAGARVVEIGCGRGDVVDALAARFPASQVMGLDSGATPRPAIRREDATAIADESFDVVLSIEALHEIRDAEGVARAARAAIGESGVFVVIEPCADDPMAARYLTSLSALHCLPVGGGLGAAAPASAYEELFARAGFGGIRRVAQTPTTCTWILEATDTRSGQVAMSDGA
jgi:hypothetical protein